MRAAFSALSPPRGGELPPGWLAFERKPMRRFRPHSRIALAILISAAALCSIRRGGAESSPQPAIVRCGAVFDGKSMVTGRMEILVDRGKIVWVSQSVGRPENAIIVDLTRHTCFP